ncbi:MAG TPA: hypothetical protein VGF60_04965 [Xanthobacteraceae bacterium]
MALRPAVVDRNVLPLDKAGFLETLLKPGHEGGRASLRRQDVKEADHRQDGLLCRHRHRPGRRAAEQRDEFAAFQSIESHPINMSPGEEGIGLPVVGLQSDSLRQLSLSGHHAAAL